MFQQCVCPLERKAFIWEQSKSLQEKQETGILQTLHYILSSKRNCFRGEDVFDSNRIINTLCIQAEQKLFAVPTKICFYKSQVPHYIPHLSISNHTRQANAFASKTSIK